MTKKNKDDVETKYKYLKKIYSFFDKKLILITF
jgi:hypothetical protein